MIGRFEQWCCHSGITENSGICGKSIQLNQTRAVTAAVIQSVLMRTIRTVIVCALLLVVTPIDAAAQNITKPGTEFRDCETCPMMVAVPSGWYMMGSPESENAFGLHDVHGNVWEWVEDCWEGSYEDTPSDGSAWDSSDRCGGHVLRGGSWRYGPRDLRSAIREGFGAGSRDSDVGFRVARTL